MSGKSKRKVAKAPFKIPNQLPPSDLPPPFTDTKETATRVAHLDVSPAVNDMITKQYGIKQDTEPLPAGLHNAAARSGRRGAERMLRKTTEGFKKKDTDSQTSETDAKKNPLYVDFELDDTTLRKAFHTYDLDHNDVVNAAELKHVFALMGQMPADTEIDAMIHLCDPRGEGAVNFEDFLNIFANAAESLRNVDVKTLRALVPRQKDSDESSSEEEDDDEEDSFGEDD